MPAQVALEPHETLFETGDSSEGGIYVVVEGALGVFLAGANGGPRHTNSLHPGESVGDLDVLDGGALQCERAVPSDNCVLAALYSVLAAELGCLVPPDPVPLFMKTWCPVVR